MIESGYIDIALLLRGCWVVDDNAGGRQGGDFGPACRPSRQWPNSVGGPFCPSSSIPRPSNCSERWVGCLYTISDDFSPPQANRDCVTRKRDRDHFFGGIHAIGREVREG